MTDPFDDADYYSTDEHAETLSHSDLEDLMTEDVLYDHLDEQGRLVESLDVPIEVEVFAWKRSAVPPNAADRIAQDAVEHALEWLNDDLGNPDGGDDDPTPAMKEAAAAFAAVIVREYEPWHCEKVGKRTIHVRAWAKSAHPEWMLP